MSDQPILTVTELGVRYGRLQALDGVNLSVAPGERLALLGHNGAGKSTLFKTILAFLPPATGQVTVAGHPPGTDAARTAVNYLPETVAFPGTVTGAEVLRYFSGLRRAPFSAISGLLDRVGLAEAAQRPVGGYSKGMRQRLGLAQALIGTPRLLLLDEPTSGLDPISRRDFYAVIAEAAGRGCSVLLSSHGLEEIEHRTERIAILSRGRLVADGTLDDLARRAALPTTIRVTAHAGQASRLQAQIGGTRFNGCRLDLSCQAEQALPLVARLAGLPEMVRDVDLHRPGLSDLYRHYSDLTAGEIRP
ncbi:ABC transporter ATP-binding protein [Thioclava atlantica]|uniref:ABC transporter ATP-binding protein n=1 Tax=Thioclava atlantica TaxID=1317124 RepID=A0A085U0R2_9RHOB|nr:ABC transporter ATP-binding protein [Thioclava atlantica]KFE36559.1 ABC transporter ATP-binding protein [Thioclava atlantica]